MKKKLTLLIFLFPIVLMAQTEFKNGALSIDFGKKRRQQQDSIQRLDSIQQQQTETGTEDEEEAPKPKKEKKQVTSNKEDKVDFRKDGVFKALFNAGINGAQIDGDGYAGYKLAGFQGGVGAMIRFHKNLSVSMEINYNMKGAKQAYVANPNTQTLQRYKAQLDYIEVPLSLNIHDNKVIIANLGLAIGTLVRYREQDEQGNDDTNSPPNGQPSKIDFSAHAGLYFVIKKHFCIGGKFAYSLLKIRGPQYPGLSRATGSYNNVLSLRFMYILDTVKKRK